jgi:hypothetical protein
LDLERSMNGKPVLVLRTLAGVLVLGSSGFPAGVVGQTPDPRAAIFVRRGCTECHAISALRVKPARDVGPDLTFAYGDVVNRHGVSLEAFLYEPTGLMRLMLASHLRLTTVDRDSMIHVLKALYEERRSQLDSTPPP